MTGLSLIANDDRDVSLDQRREEALEEVLFRSSVDAAFREALLHQTLDEASFDTGIDLSLLSGISFVEQPADGDNVIVLPRRIEEGAALSSEEIRSLGIVGDGSCWLTLGCAATCAVSSGTTCPDSTYCPLPPEPSCLFTCAHTMAS